MATKKLAPVHPGDILLHDFMEPLNLSAYRVAKDLAVSAPTVNQIVRRERSVTAEMAVKLGHYFRTSSQMWMNLQTQYDLEVVGKKLASEVEKLARAPEAAA
jgi:addiction module HigA family antidote